MNTYFGLDYDEYKEQFGKEFLVFFNNLLIDEGGYVPGRIARKIKDKGGATSYGISLRFLQSCGIAVGDINHDGVIDEKDIVCLTKEDAAELYFKYFFNPSYTQIRDIQLANRLFNFGVNAGRQTSVRILQLALNDTLQAPLLIPDGKFGMKTLGAINSVQPPQKLYDKYIIKIEDYYRSLNKPGFFQGWMNRLKRLLPSKDIQDIQS